MLVHFISLNLSTVIYVWCFRSLIDSLWTDQLNQLIFSLYLVIRLNTNCMSGKSLKFEVEQFKLLKQDHKLKSRYLFLTAVC